MVNRKAHLLFIAGLLMTGLFIYTTTRAETIYINQLISKLHGGNVTQFLQSIIDPNVVPDWIKYSLPDGLWMMAFIMVLLYLWENKIDARSIPWITIAMAFGILLEVSQWFHFVRGIFDIVDLWCIVAGGLIPVLMVNIQTKTK